MRQVGAAAARFSAMLLEGAAGPDLGAHGMTSEEERAACGAPLVGSKSFRFSSRVLQTCSGSRSTHCSLQTPIMCSRLSSLHLA